jgi:hypothetical protein
MQAQIFTEENVRKYINLLTAKAQESNPQESADETAVELALQAVEAKRRRWEETLEKGLLGLDECAGRIKSFESFPETTIRNCAIFDVPSSYSLKPKNPLEEFSYRNTSHSPIARALR